ncbi:MAG: redoxin domain-containing protein [Promethearchaeota archaeon]
MNEEYNIGFPLLGDKFPVIEVVTTHGPMKLPNDLNKGGKWFVLFSHPADFTPVCTTEFHAFAVRNQQFLDLNTREIPFPIIADHGAVGKMLGMIHPGKGSNTVRAVFIVDSKGIIRIILYYPQEVGRNMDEILRAVKALQTADDNKVATPANWPNNELFGDHVIVPPAKDVKTAKERLENAGEDYECLDWWLCHKKL